LKRVRNYTVQVKKIALLLLTGLLVLLFSATSRAQPKLELNLKKPEVYENRQLGSEKSASKKFTIIRRFFQNTYTHYNYYFNANELLKQIIDRARQSQKDDYTELLPFFSWSLENTKTSADLDSVLQTCTAGILLHDLRNDWIDNMYLLMGRAYHLRTDYDSAAMAFQFLNYAFAGTAKEGFEKKVGSNDSEGSNAFSVLSKEKKMKVLRRPPSRNDCFIWQIRNYTDKGDYLEAASLVTILRNDPLFPKRLESELQEAVAYLWYKQSIWDSAAVYLEKSLSESIDMADKSRRLYLAGQLYQLGNMPNEASAAFARCSGMALDPVMDVYARLNSIRLRKNDDPTVIDKNIGDLLSMAKKDKYADYKDIILYAAALFEMERYGYNAAAGYLEKSIATSTTNTGQKALSFKLLGDVRYAQKEYGKAGPPYDSLDAKLLKELAAKEVEQRKPPCLVIYKAETEIGLQDSLLKLANLPENERTALVKQLSRQLRKQKGIKEEEPGLGSVSPTGREEEKNTSLFTPAGASWYFYDPSIRANGFNAFKERWGARPNVDNWRRSSALGLGITRNANLSLIDDPDGPATMLAQAQNGEEPFDTSDVSFDNLYSRIPLTPERQQTANKKIIEQLYNKAFALHNQIEDYPEAIKVYEEILRRQDTGAIAQKTLTALLYCYHKTGQNALAQKVADRLKSDFGVDAKLPADATTAANNEKLLNATYEKVYDLFIQGDFEAALSARQQADSLLGDSYWRPQLLYIQSIYHIKKTEDSLAIGELNKLVQTFPDHGLAEKSKTLIDVVKRRKEIEDYLTKLEVKREDEDGPVKVNPAPALAAQASPTAPYPTAAERKAAEDSVAALLAKEKEKYLKEKEAYDAAIKAQEEKEKKAKEAADALAAQKALEEKLAAEKLTAEKALAEKQAAEKEAAEKALAEKLAAEKAAEEKALAEKQAAEKAAEEKRLAEKAAAEKAQAEKELAEKQAKEREALEKETANKAEAERLLKLKQEAEKAALDKELADKAAAEKAAAEKALNEKLAAEKAAEEKALAEKQQKEKAEAEKLQQEKAAAEKLAAEKAADEKRQAELLAAEKLAAEKAAAEMLAAEKEKARIEAEALAKQTMIDNVVIGKPSTPSPFAINGNEPQVVAIVLENIDPAYVNEVSYAFTNSTLRNSDKAQVNVVKRKLRDKLWIVELQSESFVNMQSSYEYIKYIKPIATQSLLNWLDASKYYFISISKNNLKLLDQNTNAALYYQVLKEAIPQKF